jgi:hypothetical protein
MLFGTPDPPRRRAMDSVLGELTPTEDGWTAQVSARGDVVEFTIGGVGEPDPALVAHAGEIIKHYEMFARSVRDCIEEESRDYPEDVKQILNDLQIDNVSLCWPDRPDDGMIFFRGRSDDIGLWRCDYVGRRPQGLGCDT